MFLIVAILRIAIVGQSQISSISVCDCIGGTGRAGVEVGKYCRFAQEQDLPYGIKMCSETAGKFPQVNYDPTPFEPDERLMKPFALFNYDPHFLGVPLIRSRAR